MTDALRSLSPKAKDYSVKNNQVGQACDNCYEFYGYKEMNAFGDSCVIFCTGVNSCGLRVKLDSAS